MTTNRKRPIFAIDRHGVIVGLVRAHSGAQALRRHTAGELKARVATQDDLIAALPQIEIVDADRKQEPEPEPPVLTHVIDDGHDGSETD